MIKLLNLTEPKQQKIVDWLTQEIDFVLRDRGDLEKKWVKWNTQFEARPDSEIKNFPFEKASNLVIPMQSIITNAFVARQYNTLYSTQPFFTARAQNKKWTDHAVPTQRLLDYSQRHELQFPKQLVSPFYDQANLGTFFCKIVWVREQIIDTVYGENGELIKKPLQINDGPKFIPISNEDFIYPNYTTEDIQELPWVAHRFRLRWPVIERRGSMKPDPAYINTEKVKSFIMRNGDEIKDDKDRLEYIIKSQEIDEYELFDVWCDYDIDDDGDQEKCNFLLSKDARVLLRPTLNPYNHRRKPFISVQCFPRAHRIQGIGYGQKLERLQEGITTVVNQAIDNASLANARCLKIKRGSGLKAPLKVYPGKAFLLGDMGDLDSFQLGDIYPSTNLIVNFIRDFIERDTGVSDYNLGKESSIVGSAATATSTLALIQEGTKMFDFLLKNTREGLNDAAYIVTNLYAQFKPSGKVYALLEDEASLIEETWKAPDEDIRAGLLIEVTASHAYVNQALERESWMTMSSLIMGYYDKMFQTAQIITDMKVPPAIRVMAAQMAVSGNLVMQRIMAQWNILDTDRLLVNVEQLLKMTMQPGMTDSPTAGLDAMLAMNQQMLGGGRGGGKRTNKGGAGGAGGSANAPRVPDLSAVR